MNRAEKSETVAALNGVFSDTGVVVVAHYAGLTVADMTTLRGRMREAGARVKVAKNRLARLALLGTDVAHIADLFKGPTVIAYSRDPVAADEMPPVSVRTDCLARPFVSQGGQARKRRRSGNPDRRQTQPAVPTRALARQPE